MTLLDAALSYAGYGWPVFPCHGKEPVVEGGFHSATTDAERLRAWFGPRNIGFVPGRAGLIVLDFDGPEGEASALRLGLLSEPTLAVLTRRGRHLYYRHPGGTIGNRKLAAGIDVRADKGYVLLPPSVHPSGHVYAWVGKVSEILPLPPLALSALRAAREPKTAEARSAVSPPIEADTPRRRAYVTAAIENECIELAHTGEGDRNNALNRAAWSLSRFVETGEADAGRLIDIITVAARHTGLDDEEITRTIDSAFRGRGVMA